MKRYAWGEPAKRLIVNGKVRCPRCLRFPAKIDPQYGVLPCEDCKARSEGFTNKSRKYYTPEYIKKQQEEHHGDFVQPHITEHNKLKINPEFVELYPDKAHLYYTPDEMKRAGMPKLVSYSDDVKRNEKYQKERADAYKRKVIEYRQTRNPEQIKDFIKKL